ncbi:hypothetical protein GN958_ATG14030 [Phytophthora infestans]|uniref:Uncharacterized protein n=1 Tax=Phytophthora infestans TaxID=4787 RepID=A0A8S9U8E2_PHYIN|nr:hypothetical protein GN958_ATG14030 [Phytophthora infestans]
MDKSKSISGSKSSQDGLTCLYPSKRCDNPRGVKRSGELHSFCEFHRNKANYNQRRLEHKRKYQQQALHQAGSRPAKLFHGIPTPMPSHQLSDNVNALASPSSTLDPDELWILQELLDVKHVSKDNADRAD